MPVWQSAQGMPIASTMVSNILNAVPMVIAVLAVVILRQMVIRHARKTAAKSRFANSRIVQIVVAAFLIYELFRALGAVMIVFVILFLVLGLIFSIVNRIAPGTFAKNGGEKQLSTSPPQSR